MDTNLYALERQVEMKLAEACAASARDVLVSSLREERRPLSWLVSLLSAARAAGSNRRSATRGREHRLPTPTAL